MLLGRTVPGAGPASLHRDSLPGSTALMVVYCYCYATVVLVTVATVVPVATAAVIAVVLYCGCFVT